MTDPLRDIARQVDELRKEQQAGAVGHYKEQREIGLHTLSMLLVMLCGLVGGLLWALAQRYWPSP
jgi:hypothetical protein